MDAPEAGSAASVAPKSVMVKPAPANLNNFSILPRVFGRCSIVRDGLGKAAPFEVLMWHTPRDQPGAFSS